MLRIGLTFVATVATSLSVASAAVPPGLYPGDSYHRIFVTSDTYTVVSTVFIPPYDVPDEGEIGGLFSADYQVTLNAWQAGMIPDWDGYAIHYTAVLSDSKVNARDRLNVQGPIYNMQNELIATNSADLWDGTISNAIRYDEFGNSVAEGSRVWTGTAGNGGKDQPNTAGDWMNPNSTGRYGDPTALNAKWVNTNVMLANNAAHLYAFSPPLTAAAIPGDASGDGFVDGVDYTRWADHFMQEITGWSYGDFTHDFRVDGADYVVWADHYSPAPVLASLSPVPEPSTLALAAIGASGLLAYGVRRRFAA